jgi:hypothetical protein
MTENPIWGDFADWHVKAKADMARMNLSESDIFNMIVNDFEGAWHALAALDEDVGRGNFMFARQAMLLLEWASRLTSPGGKPSKHHSTFSEALFAAEPRYFGLMPGPFPRTRGFLLPFRGESRRRQLLWGMFDLIRNGGAHQYQQIHATLTDERAFGISVSNGPDIGNELGSPRRHPHHLAFHDQRDALWMVVCPDQLFLDVKESITAARLLESGLRFEYFSRGGADDQRDWTFPSTKLVEAFKANRQRDIGAAT